MPAARVVNAFAGVALLELRQIQPGAKVVALTVNHRGAGFGGQVLKHITQRFNQGVVERIALGRAAQAHHGHSALHVQTNAMGGGSFQDGVGRDVHRKGS